LRDTAASIHNRESIIPLHYYQFNIGDYASHTAHLEPLEDIAYRRMIDYCYLNEIGLPKSKDEIGRLIRMRTHSDCIANVLREFFTLEGDCYFHKRVEKDVENYKSKSKKASDSANARWSKTKGLPDANALRPECEGNANHKPLTNNHKPITKNQSGRMARPTPEQLFDEFVKRVNNPAAEAEAFLNHYESNGWKVGKNPMKSWKHAVTNWITRGKANGTSQQFGKKAVSKSERRDEEARRYLEENNGDGVAGASSYEVSP
jgi:uncharacterized protein YdaU (DUF1376 family)